MNERVVKVLRNEKGFTLMEMLVVLFIIGVILAIALPNLTKTGDSAQKKADQANIKMLEAQAENYRLAEGKYPKELGDLVKEEYIKKLPTCAGEKPFKITSTNPFTVGCE